MDARGPDRFRLLRRAVVTLALALATLTPSLVQPIPAAALNTLNIDFSGFCDGCPVANVYPTSKETMWSNWSGPSWVVRQDSVTGVLAASPNAAYDYSGTAYTYFEEPALNAYQTSNDGYTIGVVKLANEDSVAHSFTLGCGNDPANVLTDTLPAHTAVLYSGSTLTLSHACTASDRPMGYFYLTPDVDNNTVGIMNMELDWTDSSGIIGAGYWNPPFANLIPQGKPAYAPFIAQQSAAINSFEIVLSNNRTGTDTSATYQFGIYDTNSVGMPGNLLLQCTRAIDYSTVATWQGCTSPQYPISLVTGAQYYLTLLDATPSHSGTYDTYWDVEDWAWDVNNDLLGSSTVGALPTSNPGIATSPYPDMGRHPEFYMTYITPSVVLGNNDLGPSQTSIPIPNCAGQANCNGSTLTAPHLAAAEQFVAQYSATVNHMTGWVAARNDAFNQIDFAIYRDQGNDAMIRNPAASDVLGFCFTPNHGGTGPGLDVFRWETCSLNQPVSLVGGTKYWIAAGTDQNVYNVGARYVSCANYDGIANTCHNFMGGAGMSFLEWPSGCTHLCPFWTSKYDSPAPNPPLSSIGNLIVYATP